MVMLLFFVFRLYEVLIMIRANIEAAIEAKQKELDKNRDEILKLDKVLGNIKAQQEKLLEKRYRSIL